MVGGERGGEGAAERVAHDVESRCAGPREGRGGEHEENLRGVETVVVDEVAWGVGVSSSEEVFFLSTVRFRLGWRIFPRPREGVAKERT